MKREILLKVVILLCPLALMAITNGQATERADGMRFVADVPGQFRGLTRYADPLGFHLGNSPNPSDCRHYQGLARVDGEDGTPFFMVSRSGNTPDLTSLGFVNEALCNDSYDETYNGHLIIFKAESRDKNGERLRSNRLSQGESVSNTRSPWGDVASKYYTVVGGDPDDPDSSKHPGLIPGNGPDGQLPRVYQHPGGMQAIGNMLALAADGPRGIYAPCLYDDYPHGIPMFESLCYSNYDFATDPSIVMFFDVSDPENPVFKSQFVPVDESGRRLLNADGLGVTALPDDRYLLVVTSGFEDDAYHFYRSTLGDLSSPALSWEYVGNAPAPSTGDNINQSLNFVRQGNINGHLYLAGARGHITVGPLYHNQDRIGLYEVKCATPACAPGDQVTLIEEVSSKLLTPSPSIGGDLVANLAAASGFYVSPSGELLFYATTHDNDGIGGMVQMGEWRHRDVVRHRSTLLPGIELGEPTEVDEGSSVNLFGSTSLPITKAWIQPIGDQLPSGTIITIPGNNPIPLIYPYGGYYPVVDFDDYALDDFDDFKKFPFRNLPDFYNVSGKAHSWSWYAPVGCTIQALDEDGNVLRTLVGNGNKHRDSNLSQILNDAGTDNIDLKINSVRFLNDCNQYYNTSVSLQWDLDRDGSYETTGETVSFSAELIDGPATITIPAQAQHPTGGTPNKTTTSVTVVNVAPNIGQFRLTNETGQLINDDIPFVLINQQLTASGEFSDPGVLDHQTATLDWGDGFVDFHNIFTTYDDAYGDGEGLLSHNHRYTTPGSYSIELAVSDDDSGLDTHVSSITVLTPEEAVESIIGLLDTIISNTANNKIRRNLEKARKALAGSSAKSNNGALKKIAVGKNKAATAFFHQAINRMEKAGVNNTDVATLITLLDQVIIALAAGE